MIESDFATRISSGNLLADKRFAYVSSLVEDGDFVAAVDLLDQVIALVPDWAPAFLALGLALEKVARFQDALVAFSRAEALDLQGILGAPLHRARLQGLGATAMPPAYVAALFDQYAPRFDAHLVEALRYRGPALLTDALDRWHPGRRISTALDIGCGTGLMAQAITKRTEVIDGVDLSAGMIDRAQRTGLYRHLHVGDCAAFLAQTAPETYDLVLAADVFVYLGDLTAVLKQTARVLKPGGLIGFTVQTSDAESDFMLGSDLRFSHTPAYIGRTLDQARLRLDGMEAKSTRRETGSDVPGLVVVACRT